MWTCPCGSQNEEDALACVSCGRERALREEMHEVSSSTFREIEEAQRELEGTVPRKKEAAPAPTPVHTGRELEEMEELRLDTEEAKPSVYNDIEELGRELGEVPLATPKEMEEKAYEELLYEEEEERGSTAKKVLRIIDITVMCIVLVIVAIFAVIQIGGIREAGFSAYLSKCLGIWIRSIIITQAVLIIGGIIYFLLREPKATKVR